MRPRDRLLAARCRHGSGCPGWVATDLNRHSGPLGVEQGATIPVRLATLPDDGPTGAFVSENGTPEGEPAPW